ncbi:integrin alpha [Candidatus Midichloria mitochondrii]
MASSDNAGYSVASAGDINNDGFDDIYYRSTLCRSRQQNWCGTRHI